MPTTKKAAAPQKAATGAPKKTRVKATGEKRPKRILAQASGPQCFWVTDGSIISNLVELRDMFDSISLDTFKYHVTQEKNDFADWIEYVLGDKELADELRGVTRPKSARTIIVGRLRIYDI